METIKRALRGIWKHKGRSLLLFLFGLAAAIQACPFFAIREGTEPYLNNYRNKLLREVAIYYTPSDKMKKDTVGNPIITPVAKETIEKLAALPHVAGYNLVTCRGTTSNVFVKMYDPPPDDNTASNQIKDEQAIYDKLNLEDPYQVASAMIFSATDVKSLSEFTYGGYKLVAGRFITPAVSSLPNL